MVIKNGKIVTPTQILDGYDILVQNGIIQEIGKDLYDDTMLDANGAYVTPGFVDIHTHGGYGADFMDSTEDAFEKALQFHLDNGTTTVVPTSCTSPVESIVGFLNFTRGYLRSAVANVRMVAGVHLEGPYLSVRNRGAQKEEELAVPDRDDYSYMTDYADLIKTVTISPELSGAAEMTKRLCDAGITVSGGHDDGIYPEFLPAIDAGLSHLTHHFCAMSELRFKDGIRNVGLREYALNDDRLTVELIADNRHIPPQLAKMILRAKGADKVAVVSDSLRCAGCPKDGSLYKLGADENAQLVKIGDGVAITADGEKFAGSITPVRRMVKNLIDAGIPLVDAVKTGTLTPAKIIGEDGEIGSIEVGKRANLAILNTDWELLNVLIDGKPERTI
ncbi:MAG: N-acetylglucosamine-6-phosphate deacetylase [Clostridia bacterium]|nr:N-acetylglucosamine-6-phosphate deacetylase [Clostridia bacterium]